MACRDLLANMDQNIDVMSVEEDPTENEAVETVFPERLLFGVESENPANERLQNNLTMHEWVAKNKLHPNFWARNLAGENALTKAEVEFIHMQGCKVVPVYSAPDEKETEVQGKFTAKKIVILALELGIPQNTAIFLDLGNGESVTTDYMKGFADELLAEQYVPGFKANTDSKYDFDRKFSSGLQTNREVFSQCMVWALEPTLDEYNRMTTSHLIHPDKWAPYAPSGITRKDIAIWQYGKECHAIQNDAGKDTCFHLNLVRNEQFIFEQMF